jgi:Icc-related predicted phosphoesterase
VTVRPPTTPTIIFIPCFVGCSMLVGAVGDVHWKNGLDALREARERLGATDLLLLAGDITDSNNIEGYAEVLGALREMSDGEILAVFGNEEYDSSHPEYRERFRITFLDDEAKDLQFDDLKVRLVGSTGSLDRPTWWQRNNVPDIWRRYKERVVKVSSLMERGDADVLVLLTHYAPTYSTLEGERQGAFPEMGSHLFENIIMEKRPDLVIHAHAHRGRPQATLAKKQRNLEDFSLEGFEVQIYNVSLPARGGPTFFDVRREGKDVAIKELVG